MEQHLCRFYVNCSGSIKQLIGPAIKRSTLSQLFMLPLIIPTRFGDSSHHYGAVYTISLDLGFYSFLLSVCTHKRSNTHTLTQYHSLWVPLLPAAFSSAKPVRSGKTHNKWSESNFSLFLTHHAFTKQIMSGPQRVTAFLVILMMSVFLYVSVNRIQTNLETV